MGADADYTSSTETLTFDGSTSLQCVNIPIIEDVILEENERFTVSITTTDTDVILNPDNGEVIILNDDGQHSNLKQQNTKSHTLFVIILLLLCRGYSGISVPKLLCQ